MKRLDRYLQYRRIKKAKHYIPEGSTVLDIGSDDGILFKKVKNIQSGIGIEPKIEKEIVGDNFRIIKGYFPNNCAGHKFDVITLLAVLEHIPSHEQVNFVSACFDSLTENGRVIITVPSPKVDVILILLERVGLIDGMSLEEHYGFKVADVVKIFSNPFFKLVTHKKFQLGLNNIFVFEKTLSES